MYPVQCTTLCALPNSHNSLFGQAVHIVHRPVSYSTLLVQCQLCAEGSPWHPPLTQPPM